MIIVGRILRLLVGLAVLTLAVDIWKPALVPHGVPVSFGIFEDDRGAADAILAGVGAAFVLAAVWPRRSSRAHRPASAMEGLHAPADPPGPGPRTDDQVEPFPGALPAAIALEAAPEAAPEPLAPPTPPLAGPADRTAFAAATEAGDKLRMRGELDDALEHYVEALSLAREKLLIAPSDVQAHADLAAALTNVGDVHDEQGLLERAIDAHEEALKFRRALAAHAPQDKDAQRGLSLGLEKLADTREARGHRSRALDLYLESLPIAQRLAAEHPDDPLLVKDLSATQNRVAELGTLLA